jgi:hypothetical protein
MSRPERWRGSLVLMALAAELLTARDMNTKPTKEPASDENVGMVPPMRSHFALTVMRRQP